jgi:hypothetical protein
MALPVWRCVTGVGLSHLSGEVKRLISTLTKYDQDNYPEMLGRICIINAPMVFKAIWALIKPLLNPRTLSKIQVGAGRGVAAAASSMRLCAGQGRGTGRPQQHALLAPAQLLLCATLRLRLPLHNCVSCRRPCVTPAAADLPV